ncbi:helix-turn-helix domain-containing protein [Pseudomonas sp. ICMP 561]|uniref:helix-turn-helix domain-containing protein n=1 Tax=Pseudomonas sp. ICMP 561 TaxID=1718918 RepID=UPI000C08D44F|nr:helix-turn-helix transcriptional regulator [Pseudomonas sp. ICMP 561]PHN27862.1 XRE family transcriptional regulator [Pseudomonas sp. ICMP 561]
MKTIHNTRYLSLLTLLLEARIEAGLAQKELATKLGRPQSFVSKTENAERRLDVIEFMDLCRGLDADPHELLVRLEKMSTE